MTSSFHRDLMVCAMARAVPSSGICVGGLSTPLATVALVLAAETRGSEVWVLATDGGQACFADPRLVTVTKTSRAAVQATASGVSFSDLVLSIVPRYQPFELMRPAQLDQFGRSNNVLIGTGRGILRLPGCGGIGDATSVNPNLYYYLPRHDRRTTVDSVYFGSGGARSAAAGYLPRAPAGVITELCEMRFVEGRLTVISVHPGVELDELKQRTGFDLMISGTVRSTPVMNDLERATLDRIDPLRIRDLEFLSGDERRLELDRIIRAEQESIVA